MVIGANCASTEAKGRTDVRIVTAACTLDVNDQVCLITNFAGTITLPDVAAAAGRIYSFIQTDAGTGACVVKSKVGHLNVTPVSLMQLDAAGDSGAVYSDGFRWHLLSVVNN